MSTRFKFALLLLGSLGLLAIGSALFTAVGVNRALSEKMEESGENAVYLASIIVTDKYRSLLHLKVEQVKDLKDLLELYEQIITGISAEGRDDFPDELSRLALPEGFTLWMVTDDLVTSRITGDMPDGYDPYRDVDIKGREVGQHMLRLARQNHPATALVRTDEIDRHDHEYYGTHFYLPERKLMVGLWADLEPSFALQKKHFANAVDMLQERFESVNIGPSGFLLVSDATGNIVVRPPVELDGAFLKNSNPLTGNPLIDDLRAAVAADAVSDSDSYTPVRVRLKTPSGMRDAVAFTEYCRSFEWYPVSFCFLDEITAPGRKLSFGLAAGVLAAAGILALAALALLGRLIAPLSRLTNFARRLPGTDFFTDMDEEERKEVQALAAKRGGDEIGEMAGAFLFMDDALRARVRELVETAGSRERMEGELKAAADIQLGILPASLPQEKVKGRFSLAARLTPAREVGGDLYDYFFLNDDRLCLAIGDVSEKGVPAALFMSMTTVLIRAAAADGKEPEEIVTQVNDTLSLENPNCMFVTLFVAILNLRSGEMTYANAGHNPPLICSQGNVREVEGLSGAVVGAFEGVKYERFTVQLDSGDTLFLYTDGLTEAMNPEMEQYGDETLVNFLSNRNVDSPEALVDAITESVARHVRGAPASDDMTMLCVQRLS